MFKFKVALVVTLALSQLVSQGAPSILPAPSLLQEGDGMRPLPTQIRFDESFANQAGALSEALRKLTGGEIKMAAGKADADSISMVVSKNLAAEESHLDTRKGVVIQASSVTGIAHATATLLQLAEKDKAGAWQLPRVMIKDAPDFGFRCFLVDMGRNPHSPETLRRLVDMMWLGKANYLHLHLTDDQLFSFPSTAYPKLLTRDTGVSQEGDE